MRPMRRKGEVVTITVAVVAAVAVLLGFLFRPIVDKTLPIFGGQQKTVQSQTITTQPVYVQLPPDAEHPKGQIVVANQISTKLSDFKGEEKTTIWGWIKSLWMLWLIGSVLAAIGMPGIGLFMSKVNNGIKTAYNTTVEEVQQWRARHDELTAEAARIVASVDSGLKTFDASIAAAQSAADITTDPVVKSTYQAVMLALINQKNAFTAAMSKVQNSTTKTLVSSLKNNGTSTI